MLNSLWMLFLIICFLALGFAMGWTTRGLKELNARYKKADKELQKRKE